MCVHPLGQWSEVAELGGGAVGGPGLELSLVAQPKAASQLAQCTQSHGEGLVITLQHREIQVSIDVLGGGGGGEGGRGEGGGEE